MGAAMGDGAAAGDGAHGGVIHDAVVWRRVLVAMLVSLALVVSAVASLNIALPEIAAATGASQTELQWIVDAYAVVFAGLLLLAGGLIILARSRRRGERTGELVGLDEADGDLTLAAATVPRPGESPS